MIRPRRFPVPWHRGFLLMLPSIRQHATVSFRHLKPEAREEAVQEVVCNALRAYVRLVQLKKVDLAYPTVLARYGVAQVKDGRKVGGKLNVHDVSSDYAQREKGFSVERLDQYDQQRGSLVGSVHRRQAFWTCRYSHIEDRLHGLAQVASVIGHVGLPSSLQPERRPASSRRSLLFQQAESANCGVNWRSPGRSSTGKSIRPHDLLLPGDGSSRANLPANVRLTPSVYGSLRECGGGPRQVAARLPVVIAASDCQWRPRQGGVKAVEGECWRPGANPS